MGRGGRSRAPGGRVNAPAPGAGGVVGWACVGRMAGGCRVATRLDEILAGSGVFGVLPVEGRTLLAELAQPRRFAAGEALLRQGDPSGVMYVLLGGRVRVERSHPSL